MHHGRRRVRKMESPSVLGKCRGSGDLQLKTKRKLRASGRNCIHPSGFPVQRGLKWSSGESTDQPGLLSHSLPSVVSVIPGRCEDESLYVPVTPPPLDHCYQGKKTPKEQRVPAGGRGHCPPPPGSGSTRKFLNNPLKAGVT